MTVPVKSGQIRHGGHTGKSTLPVFKPTVRSRYKDNSEMAREHRWQMTACSDAAAGRRTADVHPSLTDVHKESCHGTAAVRSKDTGIQVCGCTPDERTLMTGCAQEAVVFSACRICQPASQPVVDQLLLGLAGWANAEGLRSIGRQSI